MKKLSVLCGAVCVLVSAAAQAEVSLNFDFGEPAYVEPTYVEPAQPAYGYYRSAPQYYRHRPYYHHAEVRRGPVGHGPIRRR